MTKPTVHVSVEFRERFVHQLPCYVSREGVHLCRIGTRTLLGFPPDTSRFILTLSVPPDPESVKVVLVRHKGSWCWETAGDHSFASGILYWTADRALSRLIPWRLRWGGAFPAGLSMLEPVMRERLALFEGHVAQAQRMGQTGLFERLNTLRNRVIAELTLVQRCPFETKYLTEKQAIDIITGCRDGLTLGWICDFGRTLPEHVALSKADADALLIYDNYVVMHFDPEQKAHTPPRDPILFGVMRCFRRLYFVADWVDEVCDFTLEEAVKFLEANDDTVAVTGNNLEG